MPTKEISLEIMNKMVEARGRGALYHPTNPETSYFCNDCCVFGTGLKGCWSCGSNDVYRSYVPRWGGGSQTMVWEEQ